MYLKVSIKNTSLSLEADAQKWTPMYILIVTEIPSIAYQFWNDIKLLSKNKISNKIWDLVQILNVLEIKYVSFHRFWKDLLENFNFMCVTSKITNVWRQCPFMCQFRPLSSKSGILLDNIIPTCIFWTSKFLFRSFWHWLKFKAWNRVIDMNHDLVSAISVCCRTQDLSIKASVRMFSKFMKKRK